LELFFLFIYPSKPTLLQYSKGYGSVDNGSIDFS